MSKASEVKEGAKTQAVTLSEFYSLDKFTMGKLSRSYHGEGQDCARISGTAGATDSSGVWGKACVEGRVRNA